MMRSPLDFQFTGFGTNLSPASVKNATRFVFVLIASHDVPVPLSIPHNMSPYCSSLFQIWDDAKYKFKLEQKQESIKLMKKQVKYNALQIMIYFIASLSMRWSLLNAINSFKLSISLSWKPPLLPNLALMNLDLYKYGVKLIKLTVWIHNIVLA